MAFDYDFRIRIQAPRPTVFERLLRIEHLARWFCGWARIEPRVGGSFKFGGETCILLPEGRGWETTIDEGETLRRFAFAWSIRGASTRVSYELEDAEGSATILRARHTGVPIRDSTCGSIQDAWRTCLGNLKAISEGRSDGPRPDHSPVPSKELRLALLIEASQERVFGALTDPAQVGRWATGGVPESNAIVEPRAGGVFSMGWAGGPDRILEFDPTRRLALRWPTKTGGLRVTLDLEPKASGTAVYLVSTGYGEHEAAAVLRDRGRWSELLMNLRNFVEGGDAGFMDPYGAQVHER